MTPFKNNLREGDEVLNVRTRKQGRVIETPAPQAKRVKVLGVGGQRFREADVMDLRLVVDGKPEDAPPIDGDPNDSGPRVPKGVNPGRMAMPTLEANGRPLFESFNLEWRQVREQPGLRQKQVAHILQNASDAALSVELRQPSSTLTWVVEMAVREALARLLMRRISP